MVTYVSSRISSRSRTHLNDLWNAHAPMTTQEFWTIDTLSAEKRLADDKPVLRATSTELATILRCDHRWLNAMDGATRIARRAGTMVAVTATIASSTVAETSVSGSHPRTP